MSTKKETVSISIPSEKNKEDVAFLEAALYIAGRPLDIQTLGHVLRTRSKKRIMTVARRLVRTYRKRGGPLELIELKDGRFVLQLKPEYVSHVKHLAMRPLISRGPLKTLAYIAYHQPVVQTHLATVRGSHAYGHIKELEHLGLIKTEPFGRTKIIRTTKTFSDYFNLSRNRSSMKRQIKSLFEGSTN